MIEENIPSREKGKQTNLESAVEAPSVQTAIEWYNRACDRLMTPAQWHEIAGTLSATFYQQKVSGPAKEGDYFQIDIPGPGSKTGEGFDWVIVEKITKEKDVARDRESTLMTLRAAKNPEDANDAVAHFFDENATSTFIIQRSGNIVKASYHGRNEKPNIKTGKLTDNIRNAVVALGAIVGFSEIQWSVLIKAFLGHPGMK